MAEDKYYDEFVEVTMPRKYAIKLKAILSQNPDADVEEVRHGEWIQIEYDRNTFVCSECGKCIKTATEPRMYYPYCHCGAKMDVRYTK